MSFPLFLRGFLGVLVVFALTTYLFTGSLWSTFIQTAICAVLIQIGYFAAVLFMVWRSTGTQKAEAPMGEAAPGLSKEEQPAASVARLPGTTSSDHP
jgi:exopolysaccharide production repressor protein